MRNNVKMFVSIMFVLALVVGCFAAMPIASVQAIGGFPGDSKPLAPLKNQAPVYKDGVATDLLEAVYNGNSANIAGWNKISGNGEKVNIMVNGEKVGYFVFDKKGNVGDFLKIEIFDNVLDFDGKVEIGIRWHCSKYYAYADLSEPGVYLIPQLMQDNGKIQSFDQIWIGTSYTPNVAPLGGLAITKMIQVDGEDVNIYDWLQENYRGTYQAIIAGMNFKLSKVDGPNALVKSENFVKFGDEVTNKGIVSFGEDLDLGWYAVTEDFTGAAKGLFKEPPVWYVQVFEKGHMIDLKGHYEDGTVGDGGFDYEAKYAIVNGYNWNKHPDGLGYPGLNNGGDLFYIGVTNTVSGVEYPSFCAHGGSKNFAGDAGQGCSGYMVVQRADMADLENPEMDASYGKILSALNWIEDNVGSLKDKDGPYGLVTTQRVVAQTVIWALLGNINVESEMFTTSHLTDDERDYVMAALVAADQGYKGNIVDLVYMVCEDHHEFETCQPQLVPIYRSGYIVNRLADDIFGVARFNKTKYGGLLSVAKDEFGFDLFKIVDGVETKIGTYTTDEFGEVTADELAPGTYVFRETLSTYEIAGITGYKLVWKANYPNDVDGLYFEIAADGTVTWQDADPENPTVDNVFYSKSALQWVPIEFITGFTGVGTIVGTFDDGFLFASGSEYTDLDYTITEPTCMQGGVIWFFYGDNQPLMSIGFADPLGHNYALNALGDGLCCTRGDFDRGYWQLDAELLFIYHDLGGLYGLPINDNDGPVD